MRSCRSTMAYITSPQIHDRPTSFSSLQREAWKLLNPRPKGENGDPQFIDSSCVPSSTLLSPLPPCSPSSLPLTPSSQLPSKRGNSSSLLVVVTWHRISAQNFGFTKTTHFLSTHNFLSRVTRLVITWSRWPYRCKNFQNSRKRRSLDFLHEARFSDQSIDPAETRRLRYSRDYCTSPLSSF